jgi:hypothetical protein
VVANQENTLSRQKKKRGAQIATQTIDLLFYLITSSTTLDAA